MKSSNGDIKHNPYAALQVAGFRNFLISSLLMQIGMAAQSVAIGWEVYLRTGQAISLGYVGAAQAIPMLLFNLPAGWLADRYSRRMILFISRMGVILCSLGLAYVSYYHGETLLLYGLLFMDATFMTLGSSAGAAIMPMLVPRDMLENSMKWRSNTFQMSSMIGPALGGLILQWSIPATYLTNAVFALLFLIILFTLRLPAQQEKKEPMTLKSLFAGVRFVWDNKILLSTISLDMFAVLLGGAVYLLPIYAKDILHVGEFGLGLLRAAPAVGALAMGTLLAHLPPMKRAGSTMLWAVAGFGVATIVFGISHNFWLSMLMLFLTGVFDNISVIVRHSLVLILTPDEMRGRVSAVNNIFIGSSNEIGGYESGLVAQRFSPVASVVSGGIGTLVIIAIWAYIFPVLRNFGALSGAVELKAEEEISKENP